MCAKEKKMVKKRRREVANSRLGPKLLVYFIGLFSQKRDP